MEKSKGLTHRKAYHPRYIKGRFCLSYFRYREFEYESYCRDVNVAECVIEFAKGGVPELDDLVSALPHIEARHYSISSNPETRPGYLELMVLEVRWGNRYGLASHFLAASGAKPVAMSIKHGMFKYPADPTVPVILIALGTGLAGVLPLVRTRLGEGKKMGPCLLFLGTRLTGSFPLVVSWLKQLEHDKVISRFFHAVSREGPKSHIQDLMKANGTQLWDLWQDPKTQVFYCGPERGIPDDLKEIMLELTITEGWLSREEAMAFSGRHEWMISAH
jgi:sulfite reductase alpha subunit-like flavoprotein